MLTWLMSLAGKVIVSALCLILIIGPFFLIFTKREAEKEEKKKEDHS